jgi:hypothetical protein
MRRRGEGAPCHISGMTRRTFSLLVGLIFLGGAACRERGDRSQAASQPAQPDSAPPESTVATSATPPVPSAPSPFPADRDTTRLKATLAGGRVPSCGSGVPRITPESIGPFRPGVPIAELARRCPGLLYGWVGISDGIPVATVAARVGGATVTGFASDSSPNAIVNRVELSGPAPGPRTPEGLGVGSTLGQLQAAYGAPQASESDCVLMVWFDARPGLNFHLEYPSRERRDCGALSEPPLPPGLTVASVIIVQP